MDKNYNPLLSKFLMCAFALTTSYCGFAQSGVGVGTTTPQAALDVTSTTGGFLPPRMSFEQREKLTPLVAGLIIYQEDNTQGLYLYNGTNWTPLRGDDLGNHNVTQRLNLQNQLLVGADDAVSGPGTTGLRINGNGNVGIGIQTTSEKLHVNGNIKVSQHVEADQFKYSTAKTHVLTISPSAFSSCLPGSYQIHTDLDAETLTSRGIFLTGQPVNRPGYVAAQFQLPQSATITGLTLISHFAGKENAKPMEIILKTESPESGSQEVIARLAIKDMPVRPIPGSTPSGTERISSASAPLNHVVRNDMHTYQVFAKMTVGVSETKLLGVKVSYTVSQPD
jgi:hypothetical protein